MQKFLHKYLVTIWDRTGEIKIDLHRAVMDDFDKYVALIRATFKPAQ